MADLESSDWYSKKIEETKSFINVLSQDLGSTISIFTMEPKPHLDDVGYAKFWSLQLDDDFEKGTSILTMEQDSTCLFLQVVREYMELSFKSMEDCSIEEDSIENFDEVLEWTKEVDEFKGKARKEVSEISLETNSFWCNNMISRIRKLRAKRGPNFTFRLVSSSQENMPMMTPLSSREKLFCELMSLSHIRLHLGLAISASKDDKDEFNDCLKEWKDVVDDFIFCSIKHFKFEFDPETNSGWYSEKIAEARTLIAKFEPAFSLQSQDVGSASSVNIMLHEKLCYEIRLLIKLKFVDMKAAHDMPIEDHDLQILFKKELQESINEVNKFLTEINQQLGEKNLEKSSNWYRSKIEGSRTLIAKRYSAFPLRCEDVGYTKNQYHIFLSFKGKDTRFSFTRDLYNALQQEEFNVFMDDRGLERGGSISQVPTEAIENSKLSIIIFSKNFADSTLCLDEVVKILECKNKKNQLVWPVFYKVEPSDVRYQNKNYGEAMAKHEPGSGDEMVRNWRSALHEVSGFNAFPYKKDSGYECDFIQSIVSAATKIRDGS